MSPADVVVDLGTGAGLLALPAVGAGATRVYAIKRGEIIVLARQIARQNGLEDRISFMQGDSRHVELERRADLVVGELIGSLGLDEDIITIFCDARQLPQTGRAPATGWPRSRRRPYRGRGALSDLDKRSRAPLGPSGLTGRSGVNHPERLPVRLGELVRRPLQRRCLPDYSTADRRVQLGERLLPHG